MDNEQAELYNTIKFLLGFLLTKTGKDVPTNSFTTFQHFKNSNRILYIFITLDNI